MMGKGSSSGVHLIEKLGRSFCCMDVWPIAGLLWLFLASYTRLLVALKFSTVTEKVDLQNVSGQMAAFGDFNSDKATDILVLNTTGQGMEDGLFPGWGIMHLVLNRFSTHSAPVGYRRHQV